ncbi:Protein kinase domain-containing protein ppk32 [Elasticomyces elasticus]|nr:Protein kinase domain-containing protein ppk32 [Elasticomyces elasticus]
MITRRPAQRLGAREFQQAQYFDNILVSTIRFLDALPAKTANEKAQFMRGLSRIVPQFPKSVLEKKVLPALLEEMKDRELLALVLQDVLAIVKAMPSGKRAFTEKVIPRLREIFLVGQAGKPVANAERDASKEAGLMVLLENMSTVATNSSGKEFRDDVLPIVLMALESPTHALVDASLTTLPSILSVLDFSTIKNELFPVIAAVFSKTTSMNIKIRGLEAFYTLCGGVDMSDVPLGDGLDGVTLSDMPESNRSSGSSVLDKFTVQEKVVPLLKGIKTKEPGVMMAALNVFKQVGKVADSDFLAMDVLPTLWSFSLGPLLNLQQFQAYMTLIKALSARIEKEQTRKLQELSANNTTTNLRSDGAASSVLSNPSNRIGSGSSGEETDFESLVTGKRTNGAVPDALEDWSASMPNRPGNPHNLTQQISGAPTFSWSTHPPPVPVTQITSSTLQPRPANYRSITPDQSLSSFTALTPTSPFSQPLQPTRPITTGPAPHHTQPTSQISTPTLNWTSATTNSAAPWPAQRTPSFTIPPPPTSSPAYQSRGNTTVNVGALSIAPPPASTGAQSAGLARQRDYAQGLDKYESLL